MEDKIRLKTMASLLKYMVGRAEELNNVVEFYYVKSRDSYMSTDDMLAYNTATARLNELGKMLDFIQGK